MVQQTAQMLTFIHCIQKMAQTKKWIDPWKMVMFHSDVYVYQRVMQCKPPQGDAMSFCIINMEL